MRFVRTLANVAVAATLASFYVTVLILQLNPSHPLTVRALLPLVATVAFAYGGGLAVCVLAALAVRQLFVSGRLSPGWFSVRVLSWLGLGAATWGAALLWSNLRGFGPVIDALTARHMATAAIAMTAAAAAFLVLAVAHLGRRGGRPSALVLLATMIASVVVPLAARGGARTTVPSTATDLSLIDAPPPTGPRVLLMMLDGASLDIIAPAVAAGRLPSFGRIVDGGALLHLATLRPTQAETVWSAVATARLPIANGVRSSARYRPAIGGAAIDVLPDYCFAQVLVTVGLLTGEDHTAASLTAKPIWSILGDHGLPVGVIGWPLTHPAPVVHGYLVSDRFHHLDIARLDAEARDDLSPPSMLADVRAAIAAPLLPDPRRLAERASGAPEDAETTQEPEPLQADRLHVQIARALNRMTPARFIAVRFPGVDAVGHYYLRYANPTPFGDVTDGERRQLGRVLEQYYDFLDQIIGETIDTMAPGDLLLVMSPFGMEPLTPGKRLLEQIAGNPEQSGTHERAPDGFLLAYGAEVAPGRPQRASILDVAPTILYYLGLPVARDMDGYARADLFTAEFTRSRPLAFIQSYGR